MRKTRQTIAQDDERARYSGQPSQVCDGPLHTSAHHLHTTTRANGKRIGGIGASARGAPVVSRDRGSGRRERRDSSVRECGGPVPAWTDLPALQLLVGDADWALAPGGY